jgi:N-acetylmuramoyl-L-alanine amidase
MKYFWILDNGHGKNTAGKRSPVWADGSQLFEWQFNRDIVHRIVYTLSQRRDINFHVLVPEIDDVSNTERAERVNKFCKTNPGAILLSIHGNAGEGHGWEIWTSPGQTASDRVAAIFYHEAEEEFKGLRMRMGTSDQDPDKEAKFTVLVKTYCPAILTENFFYDTEEECRLMMTDAFKQKIANMHIKGILKVEGII